MMSRDNTNTNHRSHFVWRIKSLVLGLPFCHIVCLEHQRAVVVVDAWSPKVLSLSTHRHRTRIAFHDRTDQGNSNRILQATDRRSGSSIALAASAIDDSDDEEPKFLEVESLTPSQVTELIELSFFQACFALSKGDVDPLKLFIVAVMTASKKYEGASAKALVLTVDAVPPSVRPLEPQERELREIWIKAIYLVMGHVLEEFNNNSDVDDDDEVTKTYGPILVDLVAIHKTEMGLNVNQFVSTRKDIFLPKENVLVLEDGPEDDDLVKLAVVTQTINVLFTTLVVLQEEDSSDDGSAAGEVAPSSKPTVSSSAKKKKKTKTKSRGKGFG